MDVYNFNFDKKMLDNVFKNKTTLLLGEFNIFHIGHQVLFDKARSLSKTNKIGIIIFENKSIESICEIENRLKSLAEIGFAFAIVINFDFKTKMLEPKVFIDHIIKKYYIENFVVGEDFRFGRDRLWGTNELKNYFNNTYVCEIKKINNIKISSSRIKEMISVGEIKLMNKLLLTKYNINIKYEFGNVFFKKELVKLHPGIYFIKIDIEGFWYHGLLHMAMKSDNKIKLLNYEKDIINDDFNIQIFKESRIIINSRMDQINIEDEKNCLEFFYLAQNTI